MVLYLSGKVTKERVLEALRTVYDPEIPFNIVDLGLIYGVEVKDDVVYIKMTLTAPGCPLAQFIVEQAREAVLSIEGVKDVKIDLVFDPPWTPDMISSQLKSELGFKD